LEILHRYRAIGRWESGRAVFDLARRVIPTVYPITPETLDLARSLLDRDGARGAGNGLELSRRKLMEHVLRVHIELLPEGVYLATTDDVPGLVAQGRTVSETLEIARDVARKLLEAREEREGKTKLPTVAEQSEYTLVVGSY
jgi:predicted RNase H-like HicB family nuclease